MVTIYQIPCSCGCGEIVQRKVFKTGACKVRAYRDKENQIIQVDGGEVVQDLAVYGSGEGSLSGIKLPKKATTVEVELPEDTQIKRTTYPDLEKVEPSVRDFGKCEHCRKNQAVGEFTIKAYDDTGEHEKRIRLCSIHYNRAKQEGVVVEEE